MISLDGFQTALVELLPRLRRFARSLTGETADADDLVQTAVERALQRRRGFVPGTRLESWVFAILRNAWIDETRARRRRGRVLGSVEEAEAIADPSAPDLSRRLAASAAERALADLPEEQRTAVFLVLVEGLSYAEGAAVAGVPVGTFTSRLGRGRATLMARLEGVEG